MADKNESRRWYTWIPGWLPIVLAICGGSMWIGQYTQTINDRLSALEKEVQEIQGVLQNLQERQSNVPQTQSEWRH